MRVRVCYTVEATDEYRRAINHHFGRPGMATRADVQQWLEQNGTSCDDDIMYEYENDRAEQGAAK